MRFVVRPSSQGTAMRFRIFGTELPLSAESDLMLNFDALRFVSAIGIVFHHSNSFLYPPELRSVMKEPSWGLALFVDLFFLISGFVIALVYGGKIQSLGKYLEFMRKRIARLFPLHIVTFAVFAAVFLVAAQMGLNIGSPPDLSARCLAKTALMLHAILPCVGSPPNVVSWSISAEMALYAVFPVLFTLLCRTKTQAVVGSILSVGSMIYLSHSLSASEWTEVYAPVRALPSFGFGMCLHRLVASIETETLPSSLLNSMVWGLVALMMALMCLGGSATAVLISIYSACIGAAIADKRKSDNQVLCFFAGLGRLTYGIYMIHLLILAVLIKVIADRVLGLTYWPMLGAIVISFFVVVTCSIWVNARIETPWRRILSPKVTR
jgi:peptidoglycan/LPS O-acetylase OafA/YrhL